MFGDGFPHVPVGQLFRIGGDAVRCCRQELGIGGQVDGRRLGAGPDTATGTGMGCIVGIPGTVTGGAGLGFV